MKKIYALMTLVTLSLALSRCGDEWEYWDSDLIGHWEKVSVIENGREYDLEVGEYEEYTFYDNGTGVYRNEYGTRVRFDWYERSGRWVEMRFDDGLDEYPYYEFEGNYLILYDNSSHRDGRVFRYAGRSRY